MLKDLSLEDIAYTACELIYSNRQNTLDSRRYLIVDSVIRKLLDELSDKEYERYPTIAGLYVLSVTNQRK